MKSKSPLIESVSVETAGSVAARKKQRRRPVVEKRRIVEETLTEGVSVASVARRHDLNANLLFQWRRKYLDGKLGGGTAVAGFIPVGVVGGDSVIRPALPSPAVTGRRRSRKSASLTTPAASCWLAEVELPSGVKVRFGGGVEEKDMRPVLFLAREL